jgi:hypothetical protein
MLDSNLVGMLAARLVLSAGSSMFGLSYRQCQALGAIRCIATGHS